MQVTQPENLQHNETHRNLVITRIINAPIEKVWTAWTDPEHVKTWWGPKGFTAPVIQIDLREGGKYLFSMRSPEGQDFWSVGTFLEIDPPHRIVMTDSFADENGNIVNPSYYNMSADFPLKTTFSVIFEADGQATRLTLKYDDLSAINDTDLRDMKAGWEESLDKFAGQLEMKSESMD